MNKLRVLFVCTGNICRSPTAEGVLRHKARDAGLAEAIEIDSAGTHGYHIGDPPDARATRQAAARGYDLSDQRARRLRRQDFDDFDLILAMDRGHLALMNDMAPRSSGAEVKLFLDYAPEANGSREVPDPYYGGLEDYEHALDLIEAGVDRLLDALGRALR